MLYSHGHPWGRAWHRMSTTRRSLMCGLQQLPNNLQVASYACCALQYNTGNPAPGITESAQTSCSGRSPWRAAMPQRPSEGQALHKILRLKQAGPVGRTFATLGAAAFLGLDGAFLATGAFLGAIAGVSSQAQAVGEVAECSRVTSLQIQLQDAAALSRTFHEALP